MFHGVLDYGVGFISTKLKGKLIYTSFHISLYFIDGQTHCVGGVPFEPSNTLSGIIEAKSLEEFRNATPQITAQVLTILTVTFVAISSHRIWFSVLIQEAKILHWSSDSW
jgi:hypothetical protein